ncbi:unnamed protein product [Spirodela intermedia]|uniref:AP2/ERF domain-containing protein n=1 Tax=Spirodela intermedia TaxID=51605 RepID=A0A7I8JM15_SPIIN|nr:unnamed protein product [Spirodela intermedia]CAA6671207.1 unnamed protein product [Spirodela intermedia]
MAFGAEGGEGTTLSSSPMRGQLRQEQEQRATAADAGQKPFKGIRMRRWGRWDMVGSYDTPEKAARAYDAALYCLHGVRGRFNFPDEKRPGFPEELRLALSKSDIKAIAARFASSSSPSPQGSGHLPPSSPAVSAPHRPAAAGRWPSEESELIPRSDTTTTSRTRQWMLTVGRLLSGWDFLLRDPSASGTWDLL